MSDDSGDGKIGNTLAKKSKTAAAGASKKNYLQKSIID